jgi:hypothetical protein
VIEPAQIMFTGRRALMNNALPPVSDTPGSANALHDLQRTASVRHRSLGRSRPSRSNVPGRIAHTTADGHPRP